MLFRLLSILAIVAFLSACGDDSGPTETEREDPTPELTVSRTAMAFVGLIAADGTPHTVVVDEGVVVASGPSGTVRVPAGTATASAPAGEEWRLVLPVEPGERHLPLKVIRRSSP